MKCVFIQNFSTDKIKKMRRKMYSWPIVKQGKCKAFVYKEIGIGKRDKIFTIGEKSKQPILSK